MKTLHLTATHEKLIEIAGLRKTCEVEMKHNAVPDIIGQTIGQVYLDSNRKVSFFVKDKKNNNTSIFDTCLETGLLLEKHITVMNDNNDLESAILYAIPYDVDESSKHRATEIDNIVGDSIPLNGYYHCEMELFFTAGEGYTRRCVVTYNSVNVSFYNALQNIYDNLESIYDYDETEYNELKDLLSTTTYNDEQIKQILMFDNIGSPQQIELNNKTEFLAMLVSARMLSVNFVRNDK